MRGSVLAISLAVGASAAGLIAVVGPLLASPAVLLTIAITARRATVNVPVALVGYGVVFLALLIVSAAPVAQQADERSWIWWGIGAVPLLAGALALFMSHREAG